MPNKKKRIPFSLYLGVLILCIVVLLGFSGVSFARYASQSQKQATSTVAGMNCDVQYSKTSYNDITINRNEHAIYMVVDEFSVRNSGEVAFSYTLNLVLSRASDEASFDHPVLISHTTTKAPTPQNESVLRQIRMASASKAEIVDVSFESVCVGQTYTPGKVYYAVSTDGRNYTWHTADSLVMQGQISPTGRVYYKVAYFIDYSVKDDAFVLPEVTLLYRADCEQILK